ncbi:hypothetical protein M3Y98_00248400 [Aphelenchoides besseyi]|nr:hypothetical protein M3Y98_00248400 [Aphelenchoides besseyi]KAI6200744.1 hypothetical protein M3Y96_00766600 [Aphelenchoides besseyi]
MTVAMNRCGFLAISFERLNILQNLCILDPFIRAYCNDYDYGNQRLDLMEPKSTIVHTTDSKMISYHARLLEQPLIKQR